ncbi:TonB-dependent receptor [Dasania sp. GY-MA-18]|uniref:TonB-dependent receptor n=1 Tax=Dasania phycosphaerae TaxID=2950436 RepID=A0A9J6RMQ7_9GAMM|nr:MULTISPECIES: TonB-dependent receptor [Dasania]MCR8923041.1 TonB-dependent receptor [Dasania sp. GY-MA-18]MCZ0865472.1 TonB-dependent receptor [Dasania phycosphaerae]MCZ0869197.1 TonB-dependent receptor [Dasania phycosphaerae]
MKKSSLALAIGATLSTPFALAQEVQSWAIEEVIVTSQKRMQTLQDIPIAVSAFTGDFIADANITDVKSLTTLTPGVTGDSDDSFLDTINIRGIVTNDFGVGAEPSIGLYQDGVYLGRTGGAVTSFFDIEMVEVVKGPQGTLFGRNSSAGAISMSTKKPSEEQTGSVALGLGEDNLVSFDGMINIPLNDEFAVRAAVYHEEQDGWLKNIETGNKYGGINIDAMRLSFGYTGEALTAVLSLEYEDREGDGTVYTVQNADGSAFNGWNAPTSKYDEVASDLGDASHDEADVWGATLTLEYDLSDEYALTSITGIRGHNYSYLEDFDGSAFAIDHYSQNQEQKYYSQEFRINYEGEGSITWFAGVSYYKEELDAVIGDSYDEETQCNFAIASYYGLSDIDQGGCASYYYFAYYGGGAAGAGYVTERREVDAEYDGWGVYGDITWAATEDLEVTLGARYTEDSRNFGLWMKEDVGFNNPSIFNGAAYTDGFIYADESWSNLSPRLAVNYYINYDISVYANISQGYKAGGFNSSDLSYSDGLTTTDFLIDALTGGDGNATDYAMIEEFDQEEVTNTEIGIKSKWWDSRIEAKASVFQYSFDDYQVNFFDVDANATKVANAGDAEGQGIEADIRILPTANLDIYLGVAFLDTELTKLKAAAVCDTDCEGNTLPGTVKSSYALVGTYTLPLERSEVRFTVENFYQSDAPVDFDGRRDLRADSYSKINLRTVYSHDDGWTAEAYVENLTNEEYYKGAAYGDFSIGAHKFSPARQRTVGVNLRYDF